MSRKKTNSRCPQRARGLMQIEIVIAALLLGTIDCSGSPKTPSITNWRCTRRPIKSDGSAQGGSMDSINA